MGMEEVPRLLKEAAVSMKRDVVGAVAKLETAYQIARTDGVPDDAAFVAEELARGWTRRRSSSRALFYARVATRLAPNQRSGWTMLGKTCELVGSKYRGDATAARSAGLICTLCKAQGCLCAGDRCVACGYRAP